MHTCHVAYSSLLSEKGWWHEERTEQLQCRLVLHNIGIAGILKSMESVELEPSFLPFPFLLLSMGISHSKRKHHHEKYASRGNQYGRSLQTQSANASSGRTRFQHNTSTSSSHPSYHADRRPTSSPPEGQNSEPHITRSGGKVRFYAGVESNSQFLPQNTDPEAYDFNVSWDEMQW